MSTWASNCNKQFVYMYVTQIRSNMHFRTNRIRANFGLFFWRQDGTTYYNRSYNSFESQFWRFNCHGSIWQDLKSFCVFAISNSQRAGRGFDKRGIFTRSFSPGSLLEPVTWSGPCARELLTRVGGPSVALVYPLVLPPHSRSRIWLYQCIGESRPRFALLAFLKHSGD